MNRTRIPKTLYLGVLSLSGLGFLSVDVEAAVPPGAQTPAAVSSAQSYVTSTSGKPGARVLGGTLQGGGGPVAFSLITIYAAGISGYGQGSVVGLGFTDANGKIFAAYIGKAAQQLYLVATGGFVGSSRTYDTALAMSAPLGSVAAAPASVTVNEATTVAAAYALSAFLDNSGQGFGTSPGNVTGLTNAVAVFANLASTATGTAATSLVSGASGTPPAATVNTLANILASCIATGSNSSSQCTSLFNAATPAGGAAPATTLAAALNIARNPGNSAGTLFALAGSGPFQPALTAAPNDWTMAISYSGGNIDSSSVPSGIAIDAAGNAWVASQISNGSVNGGQGFVLSLSPQGVQGSPFTDSIVNPGPVAIDATGTVWVGDGTNTVSAFSSGASVAGSPFSGGGLEAPAGLSIDRSGNVWVVSTQQSGLTELPAATAHTPVNVPVVDGGTIGAVNLSTVAVDNAGDIYTTDASNNLLVALSADDPTQQLPGSPFSGGGINEPFGMAIDLAGNLWLANAGGAGVTEFVASGGSLLPVQYTSNDLGLPGAVATDGAGTAWFANRDSASKFGVVPISSTGVALAGSAGTFTGGGTIVRVPASVAIDASGNLWLGGSFTGNVVELVGAAKPVKTPIVGQPQLP